MINYIQKDVTTVERGIVAHGCNCQGVMGSGVALAIRRKWPTAYDGYVRLCQEFKATNSFPLHELLGLAHFVTVVPYDLVVANLFTQVNYGRTGQRYADLEAIATSLDQVFRMAHTTNLPIYMPRIGCGLGGLDWDTEVKLVVEKLAGQYSDIELNICDL